MGFSLPTTAGQVAAYLGGRVVGSDDAPIHSLAALEDCRHGTLSFCRDKAKGSDLECIKGGVVLVSPELAASRSSITYIVVDDPSRKFLELSRQIAHRFVPGISEKAELHSTAQIGAGVFIGPFVVIEAGAVIGDRTYVGAFSYISEGVSLGQDCRIADHVSLLARAKIGNRVKIFSKSVIGSDGFGFVEEKDGTRTEVPQIGSVLIEDDVRLGAMVTVDRATLGNTIIGAGSKLDDHVHVAHNCRIGKNNVLCGLVGLSGSVTLEDNVVLAGQVGVADHTVVGKGAIVAAQSGVGGSHVKGGNVYMGTPAIAMKDAMKVFRLSRKLPKLFERVEALEKKEFPLHNKMTSENEESTHGHS